MWNNNNNNNDDNDKPLNHILRKCTNGYKLSKSQEKINHLMYMDDIKLSAKNEKEFGNPNTGGEDIQSGHRDEIWHWKMCHANYEKREEWNYKQGKNQKAWRKGNLSDVLLWTPTYGRAKAGHTAAMWGYRM